MRWVVSLAILVLFLPISFLGHGGLHAVPGFGHGHEHPLRIELTGATSSESAGSASRAQHEHPAHRHSHDHTAHAHEAHHAHTADSHRHHHKPAGKHEHDEQHGGHAPSHDDSCVVCQWFSQSQALAEFVDSADAAPHRDLHPALAEPQCASHGEATYLTRGPPVT